MEITSIDYFVFVAISLLIYWKLPHKYQWLLLLIDSLIFYFANSTYYTFIYVIITVLTIFYATNKFETIEDDKKRKKLLISVLIINVSILALLKYTNLFINTYNFLGTRIFNIEGISNVSWLAPLAISFYMLQMISYLLDCYWGMTVPYKNPLHLLLYCIYFPLMVSGPICRHSEIGDELFNYHSFDYDRTKIGLYSIALGLLKKLTISNRLAIIVNQMWDKPYTSVGICVWISMTLFIFQLYTDFSGCMDIVLGISKCFGINLPENFKAPFFSKSMQEFWRRWHITLGTWLRDYIMNPILKSNGFIKLGKWAKDKFGKKVGKKIPSYLAMLILWLCMGLWHGNSWKYIIGEGLWFWLVIVFGQLFEPLFKKLTNIFRINEDGWLWKLFQSIRTFILYMFGMIFFRADSLVDAFTRIKAGFKIDFNLQFLSDIRKAVRFDDVSGVYGLVAIAIGLIIVLIIDYMKYKEIDYIKKLTTSKWYVRWAIYYVIAILLITSLDITNQEILYAQF